MNVFSIIYIGRITNLNQFKILLAIYHQVIKILSSKNFKLFDRKLNIFYIESNMIRPTK